jgi:hypothetical protein
MSKEYRGYLIEAQRIGTFGSRYIYVCGTHKAMTLRGIESYIDTLLKRKDTIDRDLSNLKKTTHNELF